MHETYDTSHRITSRHGSQGSHQAIPADPVDPTAALPYFDYVVVGFSRQWKQSGKKSGEGFHKCFSLALWWTSCCCGPPPLNASDSQNGTGTLLPLRVSHTQLTPKYLMEMGPIPYCEDCLTPQTVEHLLVKCPSLGDSCALLDPVLEQCKPVLPPTGTGSGFMLPWWGYLKILGRDLI